MLAALQRHFIQKTPALNAKVLNAKLNPKHPKPSAPDQKSWEMIAAMQQHFMKKTVNQKP